MSTHDRRAVPAADSIVGDLNGRCHPGDHAGAVAS